MSKLILVADDDAHIREVIGFALEKAGMRVVAAEHGREALAAFRAQPFDLIVLDINMPEYDGLEVCREIRKQSDLPILFLSSRDDEIDRILGLEIGGDDYVTKPFSPRELVARINVILRRVQALPRGEEPGVPLRHGRLSVSIDRHRVEWDGLPVSLTATEFSILHELIQHPHRVFSRDRIMQNAYENHVYVSDRTIDSHIRHIRRKLANAGCRSAIETIHGVGYQLTGCE